MIYEMEMKSGAKELEVMAAASLLIQLFIYTLYMYHMPNVEKHRNGSSIHSSKLTLHGLYLDNGKYMYTRYNWNRKWPFVYNYKIDLHLNRNG